MKVNFEVQNLCIPESQIRGVAYYTLKLIRTLKVRDEFSYTLSFFDYKKERMNRDYITRYFSDLFEDDALLECNSQNYKEIINCIKDEEKYKIKLSNYEDYFGLSADILHFPHSAYISSNIGHSKVIVTVHDILPILSEYQGQFGNYFCERYLYSMKCIVDNNYEIIVDSRNTKKDILERFLLPDDRVHVVYPGYDNISLYEDRDEDVLQHMSIYSPYILYLGAIDTRKGVQDLVKAYEIIRKRFSDIKLVIAGSINEGQRNELSETIIQCEQNKNIIMTGYVSEQQKRVLLSCAEIFVFPSEYEGYGLPILEAMSCGTPVITCDVSSIPEVGGNAVLYVSPHNYEALAERIIYALENCNIRHEMRENGLIRCQQFTWDKTAKDTESIYRLILE